MAIRIDYTYEREHERGSSCFIDASADVKLIKTKRDAEKFIRRWAETWTGKARIKISFISESFENDCLGKISNQMAGQIIEINNGKAVFKRKKVNNITVAGIK